ncbi:MAG: hypothetical protein ACKORJ_04550 [Bacteroidota bacterium]
MQRLLLDQSPFFLLAALAIAGVLTWLLYKQSHPWGVLINRVLAAVRFTLIFLLVLLLLGPVLKLILNRTEDPAIIVLVDNSISMKMVDSVRAATVLANTYTLSETLRDNGYAVSVRGLDGAPDPKAFNLHTSDLDGALRKTAEDQESSNLAAVVLVSDGLYNTGVSPAFHTAFAPIFTIGTGDTLQRPDLRIKALSYNKVAYQGNTFPIRAEVIASGLTEGTCRIQLTSGGKVIASETRPVRQSSEFFVVDFQVPAGPVADGSGIRRYDVTITPDRRERNVANNTSSAYVEIVDSRKKILVIAPAPHPDIKALRSVIEKNGNYEFYLHIPGVKEADAELLKPGTADMVIFNQAPDNSGITLPLVERFMKAKTPCMVIVGQQSGLRQFARVGIPLEFESIGQWDEVSGIPAPAVETFELPEETGSLLTRLPPLVTPFGKFTTPAGARDILLQRIGSVQTNRPLLLLTEQQDQRMILLTGEGIWRWRLKEFDLTGGTAVVDEIFSRLIQYTSTADDRRRFRCFPTERIFNGIMPVQFETQAFNEVYQLQYGIPVTLEITGEGGDRREFSFNTAAAGKRFSVSLPEGIYRYKASIMRDGKTETDKGIFSVVPGDAEALDLTADMDLLRTLSASSGGSYFHEQQMTGLAAELINNKRPGKLHSEESFRPLIDLPLFFFLLTLLVSIEWFTRKYLGGY